MTRRLIVPVLAAFVSLAVVFHDPPALNLVPAAATTPRPHDPGEGSCDVDGVFVSFGTAFLDGAFRVIDALVAMISPTCTGGSLTVELDIGSATAMGGPVIVGGETATVPIAQPPAALDLGVVHVMIDGGAIPVPGACDGMTFDKVTTGTAGADALTGTEFRDLLFGEPGADVLDGIDQSDCIDAGAGADIARGHAGGDVVLGGAGPDHIEGGDGQDHLLGGDGDDDIDGGPGADDIDGGAGYDRCNGGPGKDSFTGCEEVKQ